MALTQWINLKNKLPTNLFFLKAIYNSTFVVETPRVFEALGVLFLIADDTY
jgi:hypothetical protein